MINKTYKILVLIDCQNDFITGSLANLDAQKTVPNIVEKIKSEQWDNIIATFDTHDEDDYLTSKEGQSLPIKHCISHTDGWNMNKDIENAIVKISPKSKQYREVYKPTFGSLSRYGDELILFKTLPEVIEDIKKENSRNYENLEIHFCGFCTDICVISNVLIIKAQNYDCADIFVDSSCCAGVTPEKHRAAIEVMKSCQINVI